MTETNTPREVVALAVLRARFPYADTPNTEDYDRADAALAALAQADGLAEAIGRHGPVVSTYGTVVGCQCMDRVFYTAAETWSAHTADVVRAWITSGGAS